jgi:hypothetical protein
VFPYTKLKKEGCFMRLQKLLLAFALFLCLSVVVYAHPGSTHSDGGHFNRSTGEYHYHHGYPAHEHSDMDGDGHLDCPYSFDDKTDHSSNETGFATISKTPSLEHTLPPIVNEPPKADSEQTKQDTSQKGKHYPLLLGLGCILVMYGVPLLVDEIKWRFRK